MSQAGYTPIQLYYSTTAAATPSAGNLAAGELAVNITDGKLFYKDNGGVVRVLATAAGSAGDVVGPGSSTDNALVRFDGTTGKLVQSSVGILSDAGVLTGLTGLTSSGSITFSGLTSGRVTYAGTGGLLQDSANLTFDGTTLTANALTVSNAVTLSGGVANGVAYLNASKVLTTGSALTFDGTNLAAAGVVKGSGGARFEGAGSLSGTGVGAEIFASGGVTYYGSYDRTGAAYAPTIYVAGTYQAWNVSGEQMRLTSTGLGIGTSSPSSRLHVVSSGNPTITLSGTDGAYTSILSLVAAGGGSSKISATGGSNVLVLATNGTDRATLDSSGNLGLGVTPSAWDGTGAGGPVLQIKRGLLFGADTETRLIHNAVYSTGDFRYIATGIAATNYQQSSGQHRWYTAPSGTAGNAISFTQAMTLDASGKLLVGTTTAEDFRLAVRGSGMGGILATAPSGYNGIAHLFGINGVSNGYQINCTSGNAISHVWSIGGGAEAARIDSSGNFMVAKTVSSDTSGNGFLAYGGSNAGSVTCTVNTASSVNTYHYYNVNATNNGYRFYVNVNGGVNNYSGNNVNLSDERTKTNIELAGSYLNKICAIPVKLFNYKDEAEGEQRTLGVIAQDVEAVAPEFVNTDGWEGTAPEDGVPLKTIYTTDMMFGLMKAIQEQQALITALTARVAALESK